MSSIVQNGDENNVTTQKTTSDTDTLKSMQENIVDLSLNNIRFKEYLYYPDPMSPEKIFVLACLDPDTVDPLIEAEYKKAKLLAEHENAMEDFRDRIKEARKDRLNASN